jgi:hypothetical protein
VQREGTFPRSWMASAPTLGAVPWKDPRGQETHLPYERMLCCVPPPVRCWRRSPLATWSDVSSRGWCATPVAAPHTSGGSTAMAMALAESRGTGVCARDTSLDPPPVLFTRGAAHRDAPVRARFGGGAAPRPHQERAPSAEARAQASKPTRRVRAQGRWAPRRSPTPAGPHDRARVPGAAPRDPVRRPARRPPSRRSGDTAP